MAISARWLRRLRILLRRDAVEAAMDAEMRHHLESEIAERIATGMSPAEARRTALRDFGGVERFKEEGRDARGTRVIEDFVRDLQYACRVLRHNPGFSATTALTFALGIGATAAIFSVVYGVLLRPLPYRAPEQLVAIWEQNVARNRTTNVASLASVRAWRERTTAFSGIAALVPRPFTLPGDPTPERVMGAEVSAGYFRLLGVEPLLGRDFRESDTTALMLSHTLWRRLGADPGVIGTTLLVSGVPHTILGVMPPGFEPPRLGWLQRQEAWFPFIPTPQATSWGRFLVVIGRLRPEATIDRARAELVAVGRQLEAELPANRGWSATAIPLHDQITGGARTPFIAVFSAVTLLLALAVTNVGTLTASLVRRRAQELTIRRAIGASDRRIFTQLLVQSAVIGAAGTALGLLTALPVMRVLRLLLPPDVPRANSIALDAPVLLVAVALAAVATLIAGAIAARGGKVAGLTPALSLASPRLAARIGGALVVVEIALGLALGVLALLATRSFIQLRAVDPGFDPTGVIAARVALPATYDTPARRRTFFVEFVERLRTIPRVTAAGVISTRPFGGTGPATTVKETRQGPSAPDDGQVADARFADSGYFQTMRIAFVAGAGFRGNDQPPSAAVVVVNESLARAVFGTSHAVGRRLHVAMFNGLDAEVVGVVRDVQLMNSRTPPRPTVYLSTASFTDTSRDILVRVDGDPVSVIPALRATLANMDPLIPLYEISAMPQSVDDARASDRFAAFLLGGFALTAFLLAGVGIFGVFTGDVAARKREIGVRLALGGTPRGILVLFLRRATRQAVVGILVGSTIALLLARAFGSVLFGVSPGDPATFLTATVIALALAAAATALPAWQALRRAPLDALREG